MENQHRSSSCCYSSHETQKHNEEDLLSLRRGRVLLT